nr:MAG TPA: hypothetical protein [Caudoviricetes sp.]
MAKQGTVVHSLGTARQRNGTARRGEGTAWQGIDMHRQREAKTCEGPATSRYTPNREGKDATRQARA